ncbi:Uncharacterised protein [Burkholderia pseudomallei]|nr:Uncharacterised protein [Burkholderia pseudomallei]
MVALLECALYARDAFGKPGHHTGVGLTRAGHRRIAFEQSANLIDLRGRIGIDHGDDRSLARNRIDEPLSFEMSQHLAHNGPAHAEPLAQRTLDEPIARLEVRFENGGAHLL